MRGYTRVVFGLNALYQILDLVVQALILIAVFAYDGARRTRRVI